MLAGTLLSCITVPKLNFVAAEPTDGPLLLHLEFCSYDD